MSKKPRSVVLTGGAGFVGSHVAEALLRRGVRLTIVDNLDEFYPLAWKRANLEDVLRVGEYDFKLVDICDLKRLKEAVAEARPDIIVHLAARAGVRPSIEHPLLYEQTNIAGTASLLEICREQGIKNFVFGSSSSVYGATSRAPFCEDHVEMRPISPYAATKLAGELLCYTYAHLHGIQSTCLRFFTVYGPRQRPDLAIHKFVALLEANKPIPFFGNGETGRDYTYVDDIVAGVMAATEYRHSGDGAPFEVLNLGNSSPAKLTELVATLEQVTGKKAVLDRREDQPGDVPLTWANVEKAERLLGYRPTTRLAEGLKKFVDWYRGAAPNRRA